MKKIFLLSLFILSSTSLFAGLDPNLDCDNELKKHLAIVKETNELFKKYQQEKNTDLSSFQVLQFEHILTTRFLHAKSLAEVKCELNSARELIIQSDMIEISKYVLSDFKLRRIVSVLNKFKKDNFKNFKKMYTHYTMTQTLQENLQLLALEKNENEINQLSLSLELKDIKPMTSLSDLAIKSLSGAIGGFAVIWGKLSDATVWREGHLKENSAAAQFLISKLKPFDLIYESRNYTLSHFTIPGHFGHVAIWMGTKNELQELGLWDQDFMEPFRSEIEKGNNIIEIRKPGVQFVALENFINLDEIAVTRIKNINQNAESIFKGFAEQFGKKYDFSFNAHTSNKITCAELISFTFGDINWPMTAKATIVNLRPDDIALFGVKNPSQAEFVAYLKGIKDSNNFENLSEAEFNKLFK